MRLTEQRKKQASLFWLFNSTSDTTDSKKIRADHGEKQISHV